MFKKTNYQQQSQTKAYSLNVVIPADTSVINEIRKLIDKEEVRLADLSSVIKKDFVLVLSILEKANSGFFTMQGMPETMSLISSLNRTGMQDIIGICSSILTAQSSRKNKLAENIAKELNFYKENASQISHVAGILAEHSINKIKNNVETTALFINVGYIVALLNLKDDFVTLKKESSAKMFRHKLAKEYYVDVELDTLRYLNKRGVPSKIVDALNKDKFFEPLERDLYLTRALIYGAKEIVDAFNEKKIEKVEPGKFLAPTSYLRMIPFVGNAYQDAYEEFHTYLLETLIEKNTKGKKGDKEGKNGETEKNKETKKRSKKKTKIIEEGSAETNGMSEKEKLDLQIQNIDENIQKIRLNEEIVALPKYQK